MSMADSWCHGKGGSLWRQTLQDMLRAPADLGAVEQDKMFAIVRAQKVVSVDFASAAPNGGAVI